MSPSNVVPLAEPAPADTRAIPRGHLFVDQKLAVGRWLLKVKARLPHGHFGPWIETQKGLCRSLALQCMRLATGGRQDARQELAA
ncbi:msr8103 [Mesorhizobium japonicum MAFF 303099]|uniref:Msr8103 protein n=1 Tax=Mesorhizobium japonicum (strain LMG 29417 / CECT 9101 / MAFF 303099) TaxID=266835 RepID=Q983Z0_RHILO|nr:msr8103 [Mesorhizobium japonicum MAFF 303099]